ncbi:MAG: hypothetical protein IMW89_14545 [Ktedonobacteraceae bacterium]|nr:hypothetical protein [Ktedonobacteraceae bacterium]
MKPMQIGRMHPHPYASRDIAVEPNPPQVGVPTRLMMRLNNPGTEPLVVQRVEMKIARFGMGMAWESLPPLGPFRLPPDPEYIEEVTVEWTPTEGGHRCVRAALFIETLPQPLRAGRNLYVIESPAEQHIWSIPFHVGNPTGRAAPFTFAFKGELPDGISARLVAEHRALKPGEQLWLEAGQELPAVLRLLAHDERELHTIHSIEAFLGGQFLDGIQVELHRPALVSSTEPRLAPRRARAFTPESAAVLLK